MRQRIIKPEVFINAAEEAKKGRFGSIGSDAFEIQQEETIPLEGFVQPENFPDCCEFHSNIYKNAQKIYDDFPDCCESHRKLKNTQWFKKEDYSYLPLKLVRTDIYTWYCIEQKIGHENWRKEIEDYIVVPQKVIFNFLGKSIP